MNVAILGFARQGKSSYEYWQKLGHSITICDKNLDTIIPQDAQKQLGDDYLKHLDKFDIIVRTSSIHPNTIVQANPAAPNILEKVTTNTNEFFKASPTKNIIGVTGTKGKSTTSTLIAKMLEAGGLRTHLGGNIGISPLELLKEDIKPTDWVVLELASFQLIDLHYSPHIGVALMIDDEHLDWHGDFNEYLSAKQTLFENQTADDIAIYYANNDKSKKCASVGLSKKIPYGEAPGAHVENGKITIQNNTICNVNEISLIGKHNIQNILAAATVTWQVQQNTSVIKSVIQNFSGLPYRLEKRKTINNISFYNDSFASNPRATIAAINTISQPKILIVGGKDRGLSLDALTDAITGCITIKKVIIIGEAGPRLAAQLTQNNYNNFELSRAKEMNEIVQTAIKNADGGDAIILSPGFPSFDMFKDFEDRGNKFNKAILNLCKTYKQFIFKNYTFDPNSKELKLYYAIDTELNFCETYKFEVDEIVNDNSEALRRAFDLLFLMAGVSYYKTYLPPEFVINNISLDEKTAKFIQKTWQNGLGEFFYINNLDPSTPIVFPVNSEPCQPTIFNSNNGKLLAIGGGKDSLLSLEILHDSQPTTWACNHTEKLQPLVDKLGTKHISISRTWDPQLAELKNRGAYNGHVPISAIFGCVGLVLAALTGQQDIVVSNESSANSPTLQYMGQNINHQYSKTLEFENDFQDILNHLFGGTKRYYSLLRPFTELAIAEQFTPYFAKYASVFCSCNKAFTLASQKMQWCGECAKCAFSYLIFAPFVELNQLNALFGGKNLLNDPKLQKTYEELLGVSGVKPLDCVGEAEECQIAYQMAINKGLVENPIKIETPKNYDYKKLRQHAVPNDVYSFD